MCGICGYVSKHRITLETLNKMNDTMIHRGPDDHGAVIFPGNNGYNVGLAQRRLSIFDLSALGHQPMHSENKRISLVFNGEIYNFKELKKQLKEYEFQSNCDTEVIIAAYLKWGISCVERFNGMFAIALWDREIDSLYLVRDRIGKKPLYYWYENENIVFSSELKPIMVCPGFDKRIKTEVLGRYLYHQYINAPDSIFQNVSKVESGSILEFNSGKVRIQKYWDVKKVYHDKKGKRNISYDESKEELKKILKKAVKDRMLADVPVGTFLSGGYDSSLVTALAQEGEEVPVKTFSIGFNEENYNEAKYAKEVAKYLGTNHTELYIDEKKMLELVDSIPEFYDEPFADSSQIPTMLVSGLAKQSVTVALSGDGGDEFFCGYNVYETVKLAEILDPLGELMHGCLHLPLVRNLEIEDHLPLRIKMILKNRAKNQKTQIASDNYLKIISGLLKDKGLLCKYDFEDKYNENNWQIRRMLLDMDTYLPGDILCKVDRASMKYSLETRCPILDVNVMEYSYGLPHEYKYKKGCKKRILKDISYDLVPKELLDRPKVGFAIPLDKWLRSALKEQLLDMSSTQFLKKQDIFNVDNMERLLHYYLCNGDGGPATGRNYSKFLWSYFVFQKWYEHYLG